MIRKSRKGVKYFYPVSSVSRWIRPGVATTDGKLYKRTEYGNLVHAGNAAVILK